MAFRRSVFCALSFSVFTLQCVLLINAQSNPNSNGDLEIAAPGKNREVERVEGQIPTTKFLEDPNRQPSILVVEGNRREVEFRWPIKNSTNKNLQLVGTSSGCSCTSARLLSNTLIAGKTITAAAKVSLGSIRERSQVATEVAFTFLENKDSELPQVRYVHLQRFTIHCVPKLESPMVPIVIPDGAGDRCQFMVFVNKFDEGQEFEVVSDTGNVTVLQTQTRMEDHRICLQVNVDLKGLFASESEAEVFFSVLSRKSKLSNVLVLEDKVSVRFRRELVYDVVPKVVHLGNESGISQILLFWRNGFPEIEHVRISAHRTDGTVKEDLPFELQKNSGRMLRIQLPAASLQEFSFLKLSAKVKDRDDFHELKVQVVQTHD